MVTASSVEKKNKSRNNKEKSVCAKSVSNKKSGKSESKGRSRKSGEKSNSTVSFRGRAIGVFVKLYQITSKFPGSHFSITLTIPEDERLFQTNNGIKSLEVTSIKPGLLYSEYVKPNIASKTHLLIHGIDALQEHMPKDGRITKLSETKNAKTDTDTDRFDDSTDGEDGSYV